MLCEPIEHHMEEEETFEEARETLSDEDADTLGERFDSRKMAALAAMEPPDLAV